MNPLIGKEIKTVYISVDKSIIRFIDNENNIFDLKALGDCCSESWFEHVSLPYAGVFGLGKIEKMEELDRVCLPYGIKQESDALYGIKIIGEDNEMLIEMRNSSNGYYGGYFTFSDTLAPETEKFIEITEEGI